MKLRLATVALLAATLASCQAPVRPVPKPVPSAPKPAPVVPEPIRELTPTGPLGSDTHLGLLLPVRGQYAGAAEMVRDGFLAAMYAQPAPHPVVRVYDSGTSLDTLKQAQRQAIAEGARFVIGPLQKDLVTALASQGTPPAPTLALNYLDATQPAPASFYQLGLGPEDEARAAAEQAIAAGLRRAASLTPQNEWGERVYGAFSKRFVELGGELVSAQRYSADINQIAGPIRALMGIPESEERRTSLAAILGKLEFEARRRDDLDFVFLAARAEQGRLIVPQLRFHRLGALPVFATAQVFDSGTGDADLTGLRRCDMPMLLDAGPRNAMLRAQLQEVLPGRTRDQQRLFALGYDAYQLVGFLRNGPLPAGGGFPAASGDLGTGPNNAVTRGLTCAELARSASGP